MQPTRPRFCIAGGGIAGALLAWRLARHGGSSVTLLDDPAEPGATAVSGGLARGYEPDRHNAQLATRSLAELAGSDRLPQLRRTGSVYVCQGAPDRATVAGIGRAVGGVSVAGPDELAGRFGLAGVPSGCLAVVERQAGYLSPAQLAAAARQQAARLGVRLRSGRLAGCESSRDGVWYVLADGRVGRADGLVLATGAWTPGLLAAAGLPANGLRTKLIRYTEFAAKGQLPPAFVDEPTGLYGRPTADGGLLLGLPTDSWDLPPELSPAELAGLAGEVTNEAAIRDHAADRLAGVRLGAVHRRAAALDCYSPDGRLALRQPDPDRPVFTFTGGSGGAAKTALAASADAATQLLSGRLPARSTVPEETAR